MAALRLEPRTMVGCGVMAAAALCEARDEIKRGFAGPCTALLTIASKAGFEFPELGL